MTFSGLLVLIVSGIFMLQGRNWARTLYVAWQGVASLIMLVTSPMKSALIPGLVVFLVFAFFLFRSKANEFFAVLGSSE